MNATNVDDNDSKPNDSLNFVNRLAAKIEAFRFNQAAKMAYQSGCTRNLDGTENLPFEPVRSGLFYSLRLGGTWVAADWWIQYFQIDKSFTFLRLEHLEEDINNKLLKYIGNDMKTIKINRQDNKNKSKDVLTQRHSFSQDDRNQIKLVNPKWSSIEASLYYQ